MKEAMIGSAVVALAVGWIYGRLTERTRRSFRDVIAARTTYDKAVKIRTDQIKRSFVWGTIAIALAFALVSACNRWDAGS